MGITVAVVNSQTALTPVEIDHVVWALRYQALYHYNRSPWVEHGYCEAVDDVQLVPANAIPANAWPLELLDDCEEAGALGFHEDVSRATSSHSRRGLLAGPTQIPLAKVGVKTSQDAGVPPSEVASHELLEMAVDPYVANEAEMKVYTAPDGGEWAGEVGDPVQARAYPVGAPEGRGDTATVPLSDFVYPSFFGLAQSRPATSFTDDVERWPASTISEPPVAPFTLAAGGYASIRRNGQWEQQWGSDKAAAQARAGGEHPGS